MYLGSGGEGGGAPSGNIFDNTLLVKTLSAGVMPSRILINSEKKFKTTRYNFIFVMYAKNPRVTPDGSSWLTYHTVIFMFIFLETTL